MTTATFSPRKPKILRGIFEYELHPRLFVPGFKIRATVRIGYAELDFLRVALIQILHQKLPLPKESDMNRRSLISSVFLLILASVVLFARQTPSAAPPQAGAQAPARGGRGPAGPAAPATVPLANPRTEGRHNSFLEIAKAGNIDLLFVGDSITDLWDDRAKGIWDSTWGPRAANFGISGDTTQGVLWRMQNGELEGFKAKLIVLMLGTNNINRNPVDDIVEGDRLIVEEFKKRQPQSKVLILGIFPRSTEATNPIRATIKEINGKLAKLADNKQVFYMDIGDKFLTADGTLTAEIMNDFLHPTEKGYQIWADATKDRVKELMR
jgi:lysophospholipase L1-like esterase